MAIFTSESDSDTFAGARDAASYVILFFLFSLTTDVNHSSQNPPVPAAYINGVPEGRIPGVRIHYFFLFLAVCQFPFVSSQ